MTQTARCDLLAAYPMAGWYAYARACGLCSCRRSGAVVKAEPNRALSRVTTVRGLAHLAALVLLINVPLGFAALGETRTCTATITSIVTDVGESGVNKSIILGKGCGIQVVRLRSNPPAECIVGAMVTATGTYVEVPTEFLILNQGVDAAKAKLMYAAVYNFGPRWIEVKPGSSEALISGLPILMDDAKKAIVEYVSDQNPSIEQIREVSDRLNNVENLEQLEQILEQNANCTPILAGPGSDASLKQTIILCGLSAESKKMAALKNMRTLVRQLNRILGANMTSFMPAVDRISLIRQPRIGPRSSNGRTRFMVW